MMERISCQTPPPTAPIFHSVLCPSSQGAMWTLLCLSPWWFWANWRFGSFPFMSSLSFLVLLLELLQSLDYIMVKTPKVYSPSPVYQTTKKNIYIYIIYNNSSCVITDAFMDFTSGILSVTGINATGHIFASYPARHLSILGGFIDQVSLCHHGPITPPLLYTATPIQALNTVKSGKCS